jgi:hypothetical protein
MPAEILRKKDRSPASSHVVDRAKRQTQYISTAIDDPTAATLDITEDLRAFVVPWGE